MTQAVGIDLGTTYSAVGYVDEQGLVSIIPNAEGRNTTPSVLVFDGQDIVVGLDAKITATSSPQNVAQFVKRSVGDARQHWTLGSRQCTAVELSACILRKLKEDAQQFLNHPVSEAVITVPAYFAEAQRTNTIEAGGKAGLNVLAIINEPTAAAIDYGLGHVREEQLILVYDLGGGTFDVTLMRVRPSTNHHEPSQFEIVATDGNAVLGGKDWDEAIVQRAAAAFEEKWDVDPCDDPADYQQLILRAEEAKQQLSARQRVSFNCQAMGKQLTIHISREEFEAETRQLVDTTRTTISDVLRAGKVRPEQVDTVLLVGGSTRMPMIKSVLQKEFGKPPRSAPNPDETVARGAAVYAATLFSQRQQLGSNVRPTIGRLGSVVVHDVTSHTLGTLAMKDDGYIRSAIINKNTRIPSKEERSDYATGRDNQTSLDVPVLQGESEDPRMCDLIACWEFFGIPPRPAGKSPLKVVFGYDINGTVEVEAEDVITGSKLQRRLKEVSSIEQLLSPPAPPVRVVLCIDVSGSMSGEPLEEAKRGARDFVTTLMPEAAEAGSRTAKRWIRKAAGLSTEKSLMEDSADRLDGPKGGGVDCQVGLVSFESSARVECRLSPDPLILIRAIDGLDTQGGTDIAAGINTSRKLLEKVQKVEEAQRELVLFTDGGSDREPAIRAAEAAKKQGLVIRTIGCGSGVDRELLAQIASSKDQAQFIDPSQIRSSLANVAVQITQGLRTQ
ncbi:MAG: Hsp70 family protein [Planctomycetota bacterium]